MFQGAVHLLELLSEDGIIGFFIFEILHEQNNLLQINMNVGEPIFETVHDWYVGRGELEARASTLPAEQPQTFTCVVLLSNYQVRTTPGQL